LSTSSIEVTLLVEQYSRAALPLVQR